MVYYQCYVHQKLGWMIKVKGAGSCKGSSSGALAPAGSVLLAPGTAPGSAPSVGTLAVIPGPASAQGLSQQAAVPSTQCSLGSPPGMSGPIMYSGCVPVAPGSERDILLLWKVNGPDSGAAGRRRLQSTAGPARSNVTIGLDAGAGDGWASIGLPQTPGRMIGADALIVSSCASCPTGSCPSLLALFHALVRE